jgi:hypothetical protein
MIWSELFLPFIKPKQFFMNTAFLSDLNWLHVLAGAAGYFILGSIWYAPLFGKKWVAYQQIDMNDPEAKKGVAVIMTGSFILMFFTTLALSILVNRLALTEVVSGIKWGAFTGLLFSATAISITYLYIKKPLGLHLIDGFYHVLGQAIAGAILCALKA